MNSILAMSSDNPTDPNNPLTNSEDESQLTRSLTMPPGQLLSKPLNGKLTLSGSKLNPLGKLPIGKRISQKPRHVHLIHLMPYKHH